MKTSIIVSACLFATLIHVQGQVANTPTSANRPAGSTPTLPAPTAHHVVDRGANNKVWQRETYEMGPNGQVITNIHKYKELANGMHFKNSLGQWVESQDQIGAFAGGATAQQGPYQVIFANNLNSAGAIDQQTPDGKRLRSNILGLLYLDKSTGQSVRFAQIQDSQGELISANQTLYPNAFSGVNADVRYTYKKGSFEQDVILREQPPIPESFGLNSQTTEIGVMTEFINPPQESIIEHAWPNNGGVDHDVSWGRMRLGHGKAFELGEQQNPSKHVSVRRQYVMVNGRRILLEMVPLKNIQSGLQKLPLQASLKSKLPTLASKTLMLPKAPLAQTSKRPMKLAAATPSNKGYVLDYVEINADTTDITFQGDTTYFISAPFGVYGTMTFEGGTVLKYDVNYSYIWDVGGLDCKTSPYRPAVITSMDDNTVGETISGSSGMPSTGSGSAGIILDGRMAGASTGILVHDMRFCYLDWGTGWYSPSDGPYYVDFWNCQFINCGEGNDMSWGTHLGLHNVLYSGTNMSALNSSSGADDFVVTAEQVTADVATLGVTPNPSWMTNSIVLESSGPTATIIGNSVITTSPSLPLFQTVGGGSYYLADDCPYRNAGTPNISSTMLAELSQKTTYPPLVYSNITFSVATNFSIQAARDADIPDLGYHYDPLDYVFGGVDVYSNLTFSAGTAVGYFELPDSGGAGYGISIYDHVVLALNGTASQPCTVARYSTVQEGGTGLWTNKGWLAAIAGQSLSGGYGMNADDAALVWADFTRHASLAGDPNTYREYSALLKVVANNSEFWIGNMGAYWMYYNFTNCLFDRASFYAEGSNPALCGMRNCTMRGGTVLLDKYGGTWPVWIEDSAFDGTTLQVDDNSGGNTNITYCDFNAFLSNSNRLPVWGTHDVTNFTSFNWQSSWLGDYYQPTNSPLVDKGNTTADQLGLYHFTTQTNQVKETNSVVDIGYHYVATDAYGNPLDTNGDGIPDYLEDANGDGLFNGNELVDWRLPIYSDGVMSFANGLKMLIFEPKQRSYIP
jgi:hypothetical protein